MPFQKKSMLKVHFYKAGMLSTIQDQGRYGYQAMGIPVGGAMDQKAMQTANWLVDNAINNPVIEMTLLGAKMEFSTSTQIALTGANLSPLINGHKVAMYETLSLHKGDILSFGRYQNGCRCYLAIRGHWQIQSWLGSYSAITNNFNLSPDSVIQKDKILSITPLVSIPKRIIPLEKRPVYDTSLEISVLPAPEFSKFSNLTVGYFFSKTYKITSDSNRMGYRLNNPLVNFHPKHEIISSGIVPGTIQITSSGQAIILMRDAQTTGGYYRLVNVVSTDLDVLGQAKPGDKIRFILVGLDKV